jgi:hypothetical protein
LAEVLPAALLDPVAAPTMSAAARAATAATANAKRPLREGIFEYVLLLPKITRPLIARLWCL